MKWRSNHIKNNKGSVNIYQQEVHLHIHVHDDRKLPDEQLRKGWWQNLGTWVRNILTAMHLLK